MVLALSVSVWADNNLKKVNMYTRPNGGYVMVDSEGEIIGFSDHGNVQNLPTSMQSLFQEMGMDVEPISMMVPQEIETMITSELIDSVGPLLGDIEYDQGAPYNNMAPTGQGGQRCAAGCVAIAMAQIMTYYQHPKECKGAISYKTTTLNKTINIDMDGQGFDWDNILPTYKNDYSNYTNEQAAAVAKLVYYCGASAHMDYGVGASGTNSDYVVNAMFAHFDYDANLQRISKADYTDMAWHEIMQTELKSQYPIYMSSQQQSGSGHAYVCDGYKIVKGMEKYPYYHMNWGWNGQLNGWFMLNRLRPGGENPEGFTDLSFTQSIIYKIRPNGKTPVENVKNSDNDGIIYDILGRCVNEMKPGNIYINNGKKFIAQ